MPNQYTKTDGGILSGGSLPSKWGVLLSQEDYQTWDEMARRVRRDKAELFRELIRYLKNRMDEYFAKYPDFGTHTLEFGIKPILDNYYDAGRVAMQQEVFRETQLMHAYQDAKRREGGKVNYAANSKALDFYLRAWKKGVTVQSLIEEFAKTKAEVRAKYELSEDEFLPDELEEDEQQAEPQKVETATAAQAPRVEAELPDWARMLVLAGVALVLLLMGGIGGFILARLIA